MTLIKLLLLVLLLVDENTIIDESESQHDEPSSWLREFCSVLLCGFCRNSET